MGTYERKSERSSKKAVLFCVLGAAAAAVLIALSLRGCMDSRAEPEEAVPDAPALVYDSSAVEGGWEETDEQALLDALNEKLEEGLINISMNTSPVFENGAAEGNLMIVNSSVNRWPQIVEITRNDTGEVIYRSGAVAPGCKIEKARLAAMLPAGVYECTAMFHNTDPGTGADLGCAGAVIRITVLA